MTRPKAVIVVTILALAFAGIAAWLTYDYLQQETRKAKAVQPENIVVAASDIPLGSSIKEGQVKLTAWPKESIPPGSLTDIKAATGRVAIRQIAAGDAVSEPKLKPKAGAGGSGFMTYIVPDGHRAVTVAVNEVAGVAGFITPNDRVDVVLTTPIPGRQEQNISKIILQNVPVLATGQITDQKEGKPVVVPTVTLDLIPGDAEKLVVGASKGSLQLLLRNIADIAPVEARGATIAKVLSGYEQAPVKAEAPAKRRAVVRRAQPAKQIAPPAPAVSVEIIKGKERSVKQFAQ